MQAGRAKRVRKQPYKYQIKEPGPYPAVLLKDFRQERHGQI